MISRTALANILFYCAIGAAAICGAIFVILPELREKEALREQCDALVATNQTIEAETAQLRQQRLSLQSENPDSLIHAAHSKGLSAPNETVIIFPEDP
jgi:cell division protein FtsB